jgi:hypothetical protein
VLAAAADAVLVAHQVYPVIIATDTIEIPGTEILGRIFNKERTPKESMILI